MVKQVADLFYLLHKLMLITTFSFEEQGVEVHLDYHHLAFGAVAQRCQAKKKIVMTNTGDIGAK